MILKEKVAVVFAAYGAIGAAVSSALAKEGAHVYLTGRDAAALQLVNQSIHSEGGASSVLLVDATDEVAIQNCYQTVLDQKGRLDIVFNAIGPRPSQMAYGTPTLQLSYEDFKRPIDLMVGSQFLTAKLGASYMQQSKSQGTILMLTSSLSRLKVPFMAGFVTACTAIEGLSRSLATEFGRDGIKVICLNPTAMYGTRTIDETSAANAQLMGTSPEQWNAQMSQQYLLGKGPTLEQLGEVAAFLASEKGMPFNSHIVDVDGGSIMVI